MPTLHLINSVHAFQRCLKRCDTTDTIVLMHDGCYAQTDRANVWLFASHAQARGVELGENRMDYDGLVRLTEDHKPIVTWK